MILCADDFGMNKAISEGILNLIKKRKINSVSCLVTTDCWEKESEKLKPFLSKIEVGLHLSLTHPKAFGFPKQSLYSLVRKSYCGKLDKKQIILEFLKQMECFRKYMGKMPDYVDGHEFCHHFPVIREALVEMARQYSFKKKNIYIRVFRPKCLLTINFFPVWFFNQLASLPSRMLIKILTNTGLSFNDGLLGFHPYFIKPEKYFSYYLKIRPSEKDIFFCHPGLYSEDISDTLRHYRFQIYNFMMSPEFDKILSQHNLSLKKGTLKS